jgi:hypothetical protein
MNEFATRPSFGPAHQFPMTFGQILDRIYRLMRSQLKLFIAVSTVPAVATVVMMAVFIAIVFIPIFSQLPKQPDPEQMFHFLLPSMIFIMPLSLLIFALYLASSPRCRPIWAFQSPSARLIKWLGSALAATSG